RCAEPGRGRRHTVVGNAISAMRPKQLLAMGRNGPRQCARSWNSWGESDNGCRAGDSGGACSKPAGTGSDGSSGAQKAIKCRGCPGSRYARLADNRVTGYNSQPPADNALGMATSTCTTK